MKDKIFSPKMYLQGIKKIRAGGIAAAICVIVLNAIIPVVAIIENSMSWPGMYDRQIEEVPPSLFAPFGILFLAFSPIFVYLMFSFLNERSKSDFYHSIPQTRTCVFLSFLAAVVTWALAILLASSTINLVLWSFAPYYHVSFVSVLICFINFAVLAVLMTGLMSLAMTLTGTAISNVLIFTLVTLFVRAIGSIFIICLEEVNNVFLLSESFVRIFSIEYFLPFRLLVGVFDYGDMFASSGILIYSFIVGVALSAVSCLLYKKRRSEVAGQSAPNKRLQTVYRSAVTLPFVLLMVYFFIADGELESYQVILFAIVLVVYLLYELLTTKKIKDMVKALPKIYIPILAAVFFLGGVFLANNAYNSFSPSADEIESVVLNNVNNRMNGYEALQTNELTVESEDANKIIARSLERSISGEIWNNGRMLRRTEVVIKLKSGKVAGRSIYIEEEDFNLLQRYLFDSDEYKEAILKLPEDKEITNYYIDSEYGINGDYSSFDFSKEVWARFVEEYNTLSAEKKFEYKLEAENYSYTEAGICLNISGYSKSEFFSSRYPLLPEYTPKTFAFFLEKVSESRLGKDPKGYMTKEYANYKEILEANEKELHCEIRISECFDMQSHYVSYSDTMPKDSADFAAYGKILELCSTSDDVYNYLSSDRKLYYINMTVEEYGDESSEKYGYTQYSSMRLYVMLSDEEINDLYKMLNIK